MDPLATSHFSDDALLRDTKELVARDCITTAALLTRIAEIDQRKLYLREGYDSLFAYCEHALHLSDDAAYRCITAARTARQFPATLVALADGRLHLRAVLMLAPHLRSGNADELVAAATHKTRTEIALLLAHRFPRPDLPERLQAIPAAPAPTAKPVQPAPESLGQLAPERVGATIPDQHAYGLVEPPRREPACQLAPERVEAPAPRPKMTPLAPARFGLQVTIDQETHDLLQYVRALMSHEVPTGELALVLKGALQLAASQLEKRKFAATDRPGPARPGPARPCTSSRHIPAAMKQAVWERDGGQCAFVSDSGKRCQARAMLEFDHEDPVARGGEATAENLRLVCRAHNQFAAERTFGAGFMERKRAEARRGSHRANGAGVPRSRTSRRPIGP